MSCFLSPTCTKHNYFQLIYNFGDIIWFLILIQWFVHYLRQLVQKVHSWNTFAAEFFFTAMNKEIYGHKKQWVILQSTLCLCHSYLASEFLRGILRSTLCLCQLFGLANVNHTNSYTGMVPLISFKWNQIMYWHSIIPPKDEIFHHLLRYLVQIDYCSLYKFCCHIKYIGY